MSLHHVVRISYIRIKLKLLRNLRLKLGFLTTLRLEFNFLIKR